MKQNPITEAVSVIFGRLFSKPEPYKNSMTCHTAEKTNGTSNISNDILHIPVAHQYRKWNNIWGNVRLSLLCQRSLQEHQMSRSLRRHLAFDNIVKQGGIRYFIGQLGHKMVFELYAGVCGVTLLHKEHTVVFEWNAIKHYLKDEYRHYEILTCKDFNNNALLNIVKISVKLAEHEFDTEFADSKRNAEKTCFAKLVCKIVPYPRHGEQLMCYVKGDDYTTGHLKHYFIVPVMTEAHVTLGSSLHRDLKSRLDSCKRLQLGFDASVESFSLQLAEAGFFLTTDNALAQCFECGGVVQLKNFDFDPWRSHAYWHPKCAFLLANKGENYVKGVQKELKEKCDFNRDCVFTFRIRALAAAKPCADDDLSDNDDFHNFFDDDIESGDSDSGFDFDDDEDDGDNDNDDFL